jgi:hypothetical protein
MVDKLMIPKRIFTIWLGDEPSDIIKKCIESQKIPGYEHRLITGDNLWTGSRYIDEALAEHNAEEEDDDYDDYGRKIEPNEALKKAAEKYKKK